MAWGPNPGKEKGRSSSWDGPNMKTAIRTEFLSRYLLGLFCAFLVASRAGAVEPVIDSVMHSDPDIPAAKVVKVFPQRLTTLWLQALARPEEDMKCQAAAAIVLAHQRGMPGLESTVPALLRALDQPGQHSTVRLAVAHALITLDARQAAPNLFGHAQADGIEMRNLVEPALARWDYQPARAVWLERLNQAGLPGRGWVVAVQGLATVRELKAAPRLRELVLSRYGDPILRLEAARALGGLRHAGLENDAERLLAEPASADKVAELAAASLLRNHRGDRAAQILQRQAVGGEPAVAAVALQALLDDDPRRVVPLVPKVLASPDAVIRALGVEAYRRQPTPDQIPLVGARLDDPHPQVRVAARHALLEAARKAGQDEAVRQEALRWLAAAKWRALEQATILLTLLDHKSAAPRFVELLRFERPEVFVAAAWGLRRLAVPESLPEQLREIDRRWQRSLKPEANDPREMIDRQVAQLAQSLGQARYSPAAPVLYRFIPKQANIGQSSRAAAIWALGLIHEKSPTASLVGQLLGRLTDDSVIMPEDLGVKKMCAVAMGRMKSQAAVDALRKYYPGRLTTEPFPNACGWALQQITGEMLPTSGTAEVIQKGWFLEPNES